MIKKPNEWFPRRLKDVARLNIKTLPDTTQPTYEFDYIDISAVTYGKRKYSTERQIFETAPSRARRIVKKGDTLISTVRTYLKAVTAIEDDVSNLIASTGFAVVTPRIELNSSYCSYLLTSEDLIDTVAARSKGVSYPAINASEIASLELFLPPLPEQKAIAAYLDRETDRIDRKVELLEEKARLYKELKQSLINETVTRGLDQSVPLRDSGVDWIGEIPEHWRVVRHKDLFRELKRKAGPKSSEYDVLSLTLKGVIKRDMVNIKGKMPASFDNYLVCKPNDLVLCLFDMDVTPRIVGLVKDAGMITSAYTLLEAFKGVSVDYFLYYFLAQNENGSLLANSKTLRSTMTFDLFCQIEAPLPPIEEQQAIAEYLDKKTAKIDQIVEAIKEQVALLKELRKTLINDVVTGKIRVTESEAVSA